MNVTNMPTKTPMNIELKIDTSKKVTHNQIEKKQFPMYTLSFDGLLFKTKGNLIRHYGVFRN